MILSKELILKLVNKANGCKCPGPSLGTAILKHADGLLEALTTLELTAEEKEQIETYIAMLKGLSLELANLQGGIIDRLSSLIATSNAADKATNKSEAAGGTDPGPSDGDRKPLQSA